MRKLIVFMFSVLLCLVMASCGGDVMDSNDKGDANTTITIRLATDETRETPSSKAMMHFVERIKEATDGKVEITFMPDSAMGDEREITESVAMGTLEMGYVSTGMFATYADDFYFLELPYAFPDKYSMYAALDGSMGDFLNEKLKEAANMEIIAWGDGADKIITNIKKPIKSVEDLQKLKFRVMDNQMNLQLYQEWGSSAIAMGASEVYTALQQGTIDGVDTAPLYIVSNKFYEVLKYYTVTNHQAITMGLIVNNDFMASLPADIEKTIREVAYEIASVEQRGLVESAVAESYKVMDEAGLERHDLSDAERATFVEMSRPVIDSYRSIISPEMFRFAGL